MVLTLDQRVEIIMLCGREGWSHQAVANEFSRRHPDVNPPLHSTSVGRLLQKFKETGSVLDKKREATNGISENEDVNMLAYVMQNPHASLQKQAEEADRSIATVWRVLKKHKFKAYKLTILHHLHDGDDAKRSAMCEWFLYQLYHDPTFLTKIIFTDECNFYTNGVVNKQKIRYWAQENPHWYAEKRSRAQHG